MAHTGSVCCHRYVQGGREEAFVSEAKREEISYRVGFESANRLKMSLMSTAAMLAICLLALSWNKHAGATLPGENGRIAFSDLQNFPGEDFEIYTMLPDGTEVRQVTDKSGRDQLPTWSPDGTKIGWVRRGQFWVHDVETGHQRMVGSIEGVSSAVVWSPNGSKLTYMGRPRRLMDEATSS
jgi:hypothetical protein